MANKSKPWPVIKLEELAKHNTKSDGWISIKGRVYDIAWYINSHPGGVEPLAPYLGKDGTKAFNSVHPYVNFSKILKGHEKGILEGSPQPSKSMPDNKKSKTNAEEEAEDDKEQEVSRSCCGLCRSKEKDHRCPVTSFYDSPGAVIYEIKFDKKTLESPSQEEDWSTGLEEDKKLFTVKKYVDASNVWVGCYRIDQPVCYEYIECSFSDKFNTCKITLKKDSKAKWEKLGVPQSICNTIASNTAPRDLYSAAIVHKQKLNYNVNLYGVQLRACVKFGLLIGHHFNIHIKDLRRPYTPVCFSLLGKSLPKTIPRVGQVFWFIIKTYKTYGLTEKLDQLPLPSSSDRRVSNHSKQSITSTHSSSSTGLNRFKTDIKISSPQGSFDPRFLSKNKSANCSVLVMFAAGTGITPMTRILLDISKRLTSGESCPQSHVILLFWNKTEDDIIWGDDFLTLSHTKVKKGGKWFTYFPVLTHPTSSWKGLTGRPSQEHVTMLDTVIPDDRKEPCKKQALICGPTGFCQSVESIITSHLHPFAAENIYVFQG